MKGKMILLSDMLSIQIITCFCLLEVLAFSAAFLILLYFEFLNPQTIQYSSSLVTLLQLPAPPSPAPTQKKKNLDHFCFGD